jgi:hypothetical protein
LTFLSSIIRIDIVIINQGGRDLFMLTPPKDRITLIKAAETDSLDILLAFCEEMETRLRSVLVKIELGKLNDNTKVNVLTLNPRPLGMIVGNLIVSDFKNETDKLSQIAIHKTNQEPLVCEGIAYVNSKSINVLVFREKD